MIWWLFTRISTSILAAIVVWKVAEKMLRSLSIYPVSPSWYYNGTGMAEIVAHYCRSLKGLKSFKLLHLGGMVTVVAGGEDDDWRELRKNFKLREIGRGRSVEIGRELAKLDEGGGGGVRNLKNVYPGVVRCVKELVILLEAGANRRKRSGLNRFCYRHAENVVGHCIFGQRIRDLTKNGNKFFENLAEIRRSYGKIESEKLDLTFFADIVKGMKEDDENTGGDVPLAKILLNDVGNGSVSQPVTADHIEGITRTLIALSVHLLDTMSGLLTLCLYELSRNPDVQEKFRNSLDITKSPDGTPSLTYQQLSNARYVHSIVSEISRLYPTEPLMRFVCEGAYERGKISGESVAAEAETEAAVVVGSTPNVGRNFGLKPGAIVFLPVKSLVSQNGHFQPRKHFNINDPRYATLFANLNLKTALCCLVNEYDFQIARTEDDKIEVLSCDPTRMPTLFSKISRVENRNKILLFEKSLREIKNRPNIFSRYLLRIFQTVGFSGMNETMT